jgi:hypothetical protein
MADVDKKPSRAKATDPRQQADEMRLAITPAKPKPVISLIL